MTESQEALRRKYIASTDAELKFAQTNKERIIATITRQRQVTDKLYQDRLRSDLERLSRTIEELEEKKEAIARGEYDYEFIKPEETKKRDPHATIKTKGSVELHSSVKGHTMQVRKKRWNDDETKEERAKREAQADKHMGHYAKVCKITDEVMSKDLAHKLRWLPNNKGIIYKGVYFFGHAPDDGKPPSVSEFQKGGVLRITEWDAKEIRYYEEVKGKRRTLIGKVERRKRSPFDNMIRF